MENVPSYPVTEILKRRGKKLGQIGSCHIKCHPYVSWSHMQGLCRWQKSEVWTLDFLNN